MEFQAAVNKYWLPALERFKPQLFLISAGFDAHEQDLIGGLQLKESDYFWVTEMLKKVANKYAKDRIVSMLEGGYTLDALGRSAAAHIKSLSSAQI
jgi:acetoin utilization deacetylase AcuC-like enzyme